MKTPFLISMYGKIQDWREYKVDEIDRSIRRREASGVPAMLLSSLLTLEEKDDL